MKRLLWFSAFILSISSATAQTGANPKATTPKSTAKRSAAPARVSAKEVEELRDALAAQQKQYNEQRKQLDEVKSELQQLLEATRQANASAQKAQGSTEQAQTTAAQAQQSATEAPRLADQASSSAAEANTALTVVDKKSKEEDKKLAALQDVVGRFRFNGDIRVRGESFFQDGVPDRNRGRIRVRFGVDGKLNEDFVGGFALATGSLGDPNTTNESFTNFFDRKTIGLDRGYITYSPVAHKWLSLTGGKFAFPWQRSSLTFDPDINPEGFDAKLSFDTHAGPIRNFTVQGMQLLLNEVTKGPDSYATGGNASAKLDFGFWTATPSYTLLNWHLADALLQASAFAVQATSTGTTSTTGGVITVR